jgi:hypothetical protein
VAIEATATAQLITGGGALGLGSGVGIGGTYAHNELHRTTQAWIRDSAVSAAGLSVVADSQAHLISVSAGLSGTKQSAAWPARSI